MRFPQLIVFETDGRLAAALRPLAAERAWSLREPRRVESVLRLLERGGPNVLLVRTGRDLDRELALVERVSRRFASAGILVIVDSDHARLLGLTWDLGATYVLQASQARDRLIELVEKLLGESPG
jgi:hypothetical protein